MTEDEKLFHKYIKVAQAFFTARNLEVSDTTIGHLAILLKDAHLHKVPKWLADYTEYKGEASDV